MARRTLIWTLNIPIIVMMMVTGVMVLAIAWYQQRNMLLTLAQTGASSIATVIQSASNAIESNGTRLVNAIGARRDVALIAVMNNRRILASTNREWIGLNPKNMPSIYLGTQIGNAMREALIGNDSAQVGSDSRYFSYAFPLFLATAHGNQEPGAIIIILDLNEVDRQMRSGVMIASVLAMVVMVMAMIAAGILLNRRVFAPLQRVEQELDKDLPELMQRANIIADDEIGAVVKSLDRSLNSNRQQRLALKNALRESETFQQTLQQHAIVSVADASGRIIEVNDAFCDICGYTRDELLGQDHRILKSTKHTPEFWIRIWTVLNQKQAVREEICNRSKNGSLYWVDTIFAPFTGADGAIIKYIGIGSDITARKQADEALAAAKEDAEQLNRELEIHTAQANDMAARAKMSNHAKGEFLANISHELRTPMNGVLGMTELLLGTELTPQQEEYARTAYRSGEALLTLLNDILDFSKIEAGKLSLESIPFDPCQVAYDVIELFRARMNKNVELLARMDSALPARALGDPGRWRQIITNLVGNAIKFTAQGHVLIDLSYRNGVFNLSVSDTGIGIPANRLAQLFSAFVQVDASTNRKFGGTGLGLVISRRMAEMMNGTLDVTSIEGRGSTFTALLPLPLDANSVSAQVSMPSLIGERILVVDDNDMNGRIVCEQLTALGAHAESLSNPAMALMLIYAKASAATPFTAVLIDQEMPVMQGENLAIAIKADIINKEVSLILMVATGQQGDAQQMAEKGLSGYLPKPTRQEALAGIISKVIKNRQQGLIEFVSPYSLQRQEKIPAQPIQVSISGERLKRVLLAEDNPINQIIARTMLQRLGLEVTVVINGQEAFDKLEHETFDLVYMDCQMPVMDGYEATTAIRNREITMGLPRTPIVALTANAMAQDRERCLAAGMDDHLPKPFKEIQLAESVKRWMKVNELPLTPI